MPNLTKNIACPHCHGRGYFCGGDETSTWSKTCEYCNGTTVIEVPMTEGDRIRAMNDEKLAEFLIRCVQRFCGFPLPPDIIEMSKNEFLKALATPAQEESAK